MKQKTKYLVNKILLSVVILALFGLAVWLAYAVGLNAGAG